MGTRGLWGFVHNGVERLSYNHFDSYPSGLGENLLAWAKDADWDKVRARVPHVTMVDENAIPTEDERATLAHLTDDGVGVGGDWYSTLRGAQGDPAAILEAGYMIDSHEFAMDSLFCEWAYVFNLDDGTFEVYRGFQKSLPTVGRWAGRPTAEEDNDAYAKHVEWCKAQEPPREPWYPAVSEYKAVALVYVWPLHDLPTLDQFLEDCGEGVPISAERLATLK